MNQQKVMEEQKVIEEQKVMEEQKDREVKTTLKRKRNTSFTSEKNIRYKFCDFDNPIKKINTMLEDMYNDNWCVHSCTYSHDDIYIFSFLPGCEGFTICFEKNSTVDYINDGIEEQESEDFRLSKTTILTNGVTMLHFK